MNTGRRKKEGKSGTGKADSQSGETKAICVSYVGTNRPELRDVQIVEGTTLKDLQKTLKIPKSFSFYRPAKGEFLKHGDDLFALLQEGEKIQVSPEAKLGAGRGFLPLPSLLFLFNGYRRRKQIKVLRTATICPITIYHENTPQIVLTKQVKAQCVSKVQNSPSISRDTSFDAEMKELGWNKHRKGYRGYFHGSDSKKNDAYLQPKWGNRWVLYIKDPPSEIFSGERSLCFNHVGKGWYYVHFQLHGAQGPISQIQATQKYITDCTKPDMGSLRRAVENSLIRASRTS